MIGIEQLFYSGQAAIFFVRGQSAVSKICEQWWVYDKK